MRALLLCQVAAAAICFAPETGSGSGAGPPDPTPPKQQTKAQKLAAAAKAQGSGGADASPATPAPEAPAPPFLSNPASAPAEPSPAAAAAPAGDHGDFPTRIDGADQPLSATNPDAAAGDAPAHLRAPGEEPRKDEGLPVTAEARGFAPDQRTEAEKLGDALHVFVASERETVSADRAAEAFGVSAEAIEAACAASDTLEWRNGSIRLR